jgi:putative membrane protein
MKNGFLGYQASFMLDAVVVALVLVVPVLLFSLFSVKIRRQYHVHRTLQMVLAVTLLAAVCAFEIDLHWVQGGWENVVKKGPPVTSDQMAFIHNVLRFHLLFAASTPFLWMVTIAFALRLFPNPPHPGSHSRLHSQLGWASTLDLVMTSLTGLVFYYVAFVNRG